MSKAKKPAKKPATKGSSKGANATKPEAVEPQKPKIVAYSESKYGEGPPSWKDILSDGTVVDRTAEKAASRVSAASLLRGDVVGLFALAGELPEKLRTERLPTKKEPVDVLLRGVEFAGRAGFSGLAYEAIKESRSTISSEGAAWVSDALCFGPGALAVAAADLLEAGDLSDKGASTLAFIGDLVANALKRKILQQQCVRTGWNLSHVADRLRIRGPGNVLREIRKLGLEEEYTAAKKAGKALGKTRKHRETDR